MEMADMFAYVKQEYLPLLLSKRHMFNEHKVKIMTF